jgi:hypothetical protein
VKPLLSRKVRRGAKLTEWESSEHQATLDGLNDFAKRQRERLAAAQPRALPDNVESLPPVQTVRRRGRA